MKKVALSGYIKVLDSDLNQIREALPEHIRLTLLEPGCLIFKVNEHASEIGRFDVYEEFESKQAFEDHQDRVQQSDWGKATKRVERFYSVRGGEDAAKLLDYEIDLVKENEVTLEQEEFINHWSMSFFGEVAVSRGLSKSPVHWRLILRDQKEMLSQVAVTEFKIELDGSSQLVGAVGGLFTPLNLRGNGYGNALMDHVEEFIFAKLKMSLGILFCLDALVSFYASRGWSLVTKPVTIQQEDSISTWGAAVMVLNSEREKKSNYSIHVPNQKSK